MTFNSTLKTTRLYLFILLSLILSTFIALNSTDWFFIWAALEINIIRFIPLIFFRRTTLTWNGATEYFFPQAAGSLIILTSVAVLLTDYSQEQLTTIIIFTAILIKGGFAPFHHWFINVFSMLDSWIMCFLISTWQKLIPVFFLSSAILNTNSNIIIVIAIAGASWGILTAANQTNIQIFIAFSSVGNLGWFLMLTPTTKHFALIFFFLYSFMLASLIYFLSATPNQLTPQFSSSTQISIPQKAAIILCLLSLSGFPFTTGFIIKIWVISSVLKQTEVILWLVLIPLVFRIVAYARFIFYLLFNFQTASTPTPNTKTHNNLFSLVLLLSIHCVPAAITLPQLPL